MKIGKIELSSKVLLAPMSGISDAPFREITKKFKPALVFSEMIASRALITKNKKTLKMVKKNNNEILAIQLAGCDPFIMGEAAKISSDMGADIIDINMGCPVKKVVNGYAGSALMRDEELATNIIDNVVNSVKLPVTLKMRTGWDDNSRNAPKLAKIAESIGIKMITVHGRTRCQMYRGKSDWSFIKKVKNNVNIPVIANGDIENISDANKVLEVSGADGLMIGRGSYGKPWVFEQINLLLQKKEYIQPSIELIKEIVLNHFDLSIRHYGDDLGVKNFRKHLGWYSKKLKNSNKFRHEINNCIDKKRITFLIKSFFNYENSSNEN